MKKLRYNSLTPQNILKEIYLEMKCYLTLNWHSRIKMSFKRPNLCNMYYDVMTKSNMRCLFSWDFVFDNEEVGCLNMRTPRDKEGMGN